MLRRGPLAIVGACRLCLVEIKGSNKLLPACVTQVEEGMEVTIDSERLDSYRKLILELLFAERNHVCSVCVVNGHCELQSLAQRLGIDHMSTALSASQGRRWMPRIALHARSQPLHPVHTLRARLRAKSRARIPGTSWAAAWTRAVITDLNEPWGSSESCTSCGKCVHVCPTGALFEKGKSVAEMSKRRQFLPYLTLMRETRQ